ncbi:hypothetical protein PIB30_034624 [Stylosanthes scabra]|uniref:Uncharacterized protein n=1 Tax=Stylosanthes scabra TaxID=79078 RepID=A0ABU6XE86_9FABA|nr:hypothetical protein [Stylosanthes scabra]
MHFANNRVTKRSHSSTAWVQSQSCISVDRATTQYHLAESKLRLKLEFQVSGPGPRLFEGPTSTYMRKEQLKHKTPISIRISLEFRIVLRDQELEGIDHSGDEQHRSHQYQNNQYEELDLNTNPNGNTGVEDANMNSGAAQNGGLQPRVTILETRRIQSTVNSCWSGGNSLNRDQRRTPPPRPFGGIGSNEHRISQELRHCMQSVEHKVQELRRENERLLLHTSFHISIAFSTWTETPSYQFGGNTYLVGRG